jgi:hypothetical protein
MKIPSKNTCAHAIGKSIHTFGPKAPAALSLELSDRFVRATTADKITEMVSLGQLVRVEDKVELSAPLMRYFDQCEADMMPKTVTPGSVATARTPKPFVPLVRAPARIDGMREGAADHRQYKSRHF